MHMLTYTHTCAHPRMHTATHVHTHAETAEAAEGDADPLSETARSKGRKPQEKQEAGKQKGQGLAHPCRMPLAAQPLVRVQYQGGSRVPAP